MADPTPTALTVGEAMSLSTTLDWPSEFIVCAVERIVSVREAAARADERDRIITTAQVERDTARAEVAALRGMLAEATAHETEPCRLDHNGNCQEHGYHAGPCLIPRARAALAIGADA